MAPVGYLCRCLSLLQYWVSNKMHWCELCRCWMNDTKAALANHERGTQHQAALAKSEDNRCDMCTRQWQLGSHRHLLPLEVHERVAVVTVSAVHSTLHTPFPRMHTRSRAVRAVV